MILLSEVKTAIKSLKNHKHEGPDGIKYEFLKYGGEALAKEIHKLFTMVFNTEIVPQQWETSILINIDKGKKDKEKLENKRGISLCNNISKLFEKILVKRLNKNLNFTEAQVGARPQKSTLNNLFTIKTLIQQRNIEKKETYVAFIDLEKAYDKVWSNAIFYLLWERGIEGKLWRLMYKLNQNLKTTVTTKFGQTETINIIDSIRQGKPLSGPEFALLIDQLNVDIRAEGYGLKFSHLLIVSLLFMDDITLLAESEIELIEILHHTNIFLNKWHLKINPSKSGIIIFNNNHKKKTTEKYKIGNNIINVVNKYKFLGEFLTNDLSLSCHISEKSNMVEGLLQNCIFVASNNILSQIKLQTLLKLYKSCIVPALIYGCETWIPTAEETSKLIQVQLSTIRRIIKIPVSTPLVSIYIETGELPINLEIEKRQLNYLWVLLNAEDQSNDLLQLQLTEFKSNCDNLGNHFLNLLRKFNITEPLTTIAKLSKNKWKKLIAKKITEFNNEYCSKKSQKLSKLTTLNKYKKQPKPEKYIKELKRTEAAIIFKLRTRMLNLRNNFRNTAKGKIECPRCHQERDDENHLFERCTQLKLLYTKYKITTYEEIFDARVKMDRLKEIIDFIKEVGLE